MSLKKRSAMLTATAGRRYLRAAIVAAAGLGYGLAPAFADTPAITTPKGPPLASPAMTGGSIFQTLMIKIPNIQVSGSNLDGPTIKAILSGHGSANEVRRFLHLDAQSVRIPLMTITWKMPLLAGNSANNVTIVYKNLDFENIHDGIVTKAIFGETTIVGLFNDATIDYLRSTVSSLNIAAAVAYDAGSSSSPTEPMRKFYTSQVSLGWTVEALDNQCKFGPANIGEVDLRPMKYSLNQVVAIFVAIRREKHPMPKNLFPSVALLSSMMNSIRISGQTIAGMTCTETVPHYGKFSWSFGTMKIGAVSGTTSPDIFVDNLLFKANDITFSMKALTLKPIDLSDTFKTLEEGGPQADHAWFAKHVRALIPRFSGLSLSGLDLDAPDPKAPGQRTRVSIGNLDISLDNYVHPGFDS